MRKEDFPQTVTETLPSIEVKSRDYIVVFALDEPRYALYSSAVERVVRAVEITPLPKAPEIVLGVINVQGRVLPVLDIRKRFRLPAREMTLDDRFIIARTSRRSVVLAVDSVAGVRELSERQLVSATQALPFAEYVSGVVKLEDNLVLIHDLDRFLSLDEEKELDKSLSREHGMKHTLAHGVLSQLSDMIAAKTALHFPRRWGDLENKVGSAAKEFGYADKEKFINWLLSSPLTAGQMDVLASYLTIHETYFWREPHMFEALVAQVLPALVRSPGNSGRRLRIWSAGCATGEEPYSLAISLHRAIPVLKEWNITILATDINPLILRKAMAGVYGKWSFRNAPQWLIDGYFHCPKDGVFEIRPEIRKMVTFTYLNLAEDNYPSPLNNTSAMDIIFCRNVLMYFAPERAKQVGEGLFRSLVEGGWLMVGASELSQNLFSQFASVKFLGAIAYRKETPGSSLPMDFPYESLLFQKAAEPPPAFQFHENEKPLATVNELPALNEYAAVAEQYAPPTDREKAVQPAEGPPSSRFATIRALADVGKLPEALVLCEEALSSDKLDPRLHFLRAIILQELNRVEEAGDSLKRTLYLDQDFVLAHFALGNIMLRQGKALTAKKHFENVISLLKENRPEDILPESEGLTAGRFREIIQATMETGALA